MRLTDFLAWRRTGFRQVQRAQRRSSRLVLEPLEDRTMPSFLGPVSYAIGEPYGNLTVATGDFNRDGTPDLVALKMVWGGVSVALGKGDGTFQPARDFSVVGTPSAVAVGDFNGDGKADLVTADNYSGALNVLLGNGDGTFQPSLLFGPPTTPLGSQTSDAVAVGDLNGDGKLDLVTLGSAGNYYGSGAEYVNVLLGHGDGTFSAAQTAQLPVLGLTLPSLALGDFNGDGKLDAVITTANSVLVLPGNGDGTLGAPSSFATSSGPPGSVVVGDVNGDGRPDIATAGGAGVSVLLGNGDGTFQAARNFTAGVGPQSLTVADLNRDGKPDLAVANVGMNGGSASVSVLLGNGDGTFQSPLNYAAGPNPWGLVSADFNGDGYPDLAVANNSNTSFGQLSVLLNAADWSTPQASSFAVSGFPSAVTAGASDTFTITAKTGNGATATGYTGTVHFTSTDLQAVLPADYTFTAADQGVHTFSATLKTAGAQSLTVADTTANLSGTKTGITVNPASASTFSFSNVASVDAGNGFYLWVCVLDAYGNQVSNYGGTVHFSSSDTKATLPADYTFTAADAGFHRFIATLKTAGTQSITATDTRTASIAGIDGGITVNPVAASKFLITAPSSVIAGTSFSLTLKVEDAYGNIITNYTGTVQFSSTDGKAALPGNYTFTAADAGAHTFTGLVLRTKGNQKITITDTHNKSLTGSVIIDVL